MSTHNFSYNFLTRIKYIFYTVATVAYEGVGALDMFSHEVAITFYALMFYGLGEGYPVCTQNTLINTLLYIEIHYF
jgi:hypothetical protein